MLPFQSMARGELRYRLHHTNTSPYTLPTFKITIRKRSERKMKNLEFNTDGFTGKLMQKAGNKLADMAVDARECFFWSWYEPELPEEMIEELLINEK